VERYAIYSAAEDIASFLYHYPEVESRFSSLRRGVLANWPLNFILYLLAVYVLTTPRTRGECHIGEETEPDAESYSAVGPTE
jgi:hypothetical protein